MNKSLRYSEEVLDESFLGVQAAWTATAEAFELSLHTAEPEGTGGERVAEVAYPFYERVMLARTAAAWQRQGNVVSNRVEARFALNVTGPTVTATHWALTPKGDTHPRYRGQFDQPLVIEPGIRPVVDPGRIQVKER